MRDAYCRPSSANPVAEIADFALRCRASADIIRCQPSRIETVSVPSLPERMHAVLDDRLVEAFSEAAAHFGTKDVVLFFEEAEACLTALPREFLLRDPNAPAFLREYIDKAANDLDFPTGDDPAFWLVYFGADGRTALCAIHAKVIAKAGSSLRVQ